MRIDKYLKLSRLIKRRTLAKEACEKERIYINEKIAKPSDDVKVGDIITIQLSKTIRARVLNLNEHAKKEDAKEMYEII